MCVIVYVCVCAHRKQKFFPTRTGVTAIFIYGGDGDDIACICALVLLHLSRARASLLC